MQSSSRRRSSSWRKERGMSREAMEWEATAGGQEDSSTTSSSASAAATSSSSSSTTSSSEPSFKATQMWQDLVVGFRDGMPRQRRRVKMKLYDECFTGSEAVEWLHDYLQSSGNFGSVSKQQAVKLLQKFQQTNVIKEVKGKHRQFSEDSGRRYSFVTEPGPFNFVEETSPVGSPMSVERGRSLSCSVTRGERMRGSRRGRPRAAAGPFPPTNSHVLSKVVEEEEEEQDGGDGGVGKKGKRKIPRLTLVDANTGAGKPSPSQVAEIWKELTLARLLRLVEMPSLDSVLSHDAVDGKNIVQNAILGLVPRFLRSGSTSGHQGRPHPSRPAATSGQASHGQEAVEDFPGWVITMLNCLSKWPEGCPTDVVTGQPNTFGLESEVLQSLTQYLYGLPEPLISSNLYDIHIAVNRLVKDKKETAREALQLCSLLMPQTNRTRIHRVLRTINKASNNPILHLSSTQTNHDLLIERLGMVVLRPGSSLDVTESERSAIHSVVSLMSQHYNYIFKVPEDLKQEADKRIRALATGTDTGADSLSNPKTFCKRVSREEYSSQMKTTSQQSISRLLDQIAADENMNDREKKQKLKLFQQQYPEIYVKKFGKTPVTATTSSPTSSQRLSSFTRSWQFQSLRKHRKPNLR